MTDFISQPYPLYGFEYIGEPEARPNQPGRLFLVVGWTHQSNDLNGNPILDPMAFPLDGPTGGAEVIHGPFRIFTDLREAALERQEAIRKDGYDRALQEGFGTVEVPA